MAPSIPWTGRSRELTIEAASGVTLGADLVLPYRDDPRGAVVLAHARRESRRDARNRVAVGALTRAGFATLLLDLLTLHEKVGAPQRPELGLLSARIVAATERLSGEPETDGL